MLAEPKTAMALAAARNSAWLSQQDPEFCERVLRNSKLIKFAKDERIIGLDEKGSNIYFLFEGAVQVLVPRPDLEIVPSHVVSPLEWFGEYGALTGRDNIAEYRARMPSSALVVLQSRLAALEGEPSFRKAATDLFGDTFKRQLELSTGLAGLNGEERVRSKLHALAGAPRPAGSMERKIVVSHDELAAISCVSRTVVAKVLSQLSDEGTIVTGYRNITVLHRDRLIS